MWTIREAVETTSSWTPSAFTIEPVCVRLPERWKPEPPIGSQPVKPGRKCMQTQLWASGASTKSKARSGTAPTMRFDSFVPKVCSHMFQQSRS